MSFAATDLEALIPRLRRYAHALTRHGTQAEDLVQDTLERAWARRRQWRPDTNLRAWVFTIMHSIFLNGLRRYEPEALADSFVGEAVHDGTDGLLDLERALGRLPPAQRSVLLLVGLEDLSYQQAAGVLEIPVGTVMSRLARARTALRALMDEQPVREAQARPALKVVK